LPRLNRLDNIRACLQSSKPEKNRSDGNHGEIVGGTLFVPCGDPSKVLQPIDQALDDVALAVCLAVEAGLAVLVGLGRDHRDDAALPQGKPDRGRFGIRVKSGHKPKPG
jgi:hypothetical protein